MTPNEKNLRKINNGLAPDRVQVEFGVGWVTFTKFWNGILPYNATTYPLRPNSMIRLINFMLIHGRRIEENIGAEIKTRKGIQYTDTYYKFTYYRS